MNGYRAVLFDLDGTLLDTLGDLADAVNFMLDTLNCPRRTEEEVRVFIGNGLKKLVLRALPAGREDLMERGLELFSEYYQAHMDVKTAPYPGVPELLTALRDCGLRVGVLSNKKDGPVIQLCARYFGPLVDSARGERMGIPRKPAPDAVVQLLEELGVRPEDAVYCGDSDVDVDTAHNANLACIGVSWGFRSSQCLIEAGADTVIDRVEAFLPAMDALWAERHGR